MIARSVNKTTFLLHNFGVFPAKLLSALTKDEVAKKVSLRPFRGFLAMVNGERYVSITTPRVAADRKWKEKIKNHETR